VIVFVMLLYSGAYLARLYVYLSVCPSFTYKFLTHNKKCVQKKQTGMNDCPNLRGNRNKKFELMLTRRAKAYSSSCSQIVLVYLQPFRRNSLLKCAARPKVAKTTMIFFILEFRVFQSHRCWYD